MVLPTSCDATSAEAPYGPVCRCNGDARQRPEVHQDDLAAQLGGAQWLGVGPPGRPAERGHVQTFEHAHLAK